MTSCSHPIVDLKDYVFFQEGPGLRKWQWTEVGMKVINVTNILADGSVDISNTSRFISLDEFKEKYSHFAIDAGDVVVASSGNTYGKVGRIKGCHLPIMMNTSVIRFRPINPNKLHPDYLYAFLRSDFFRGQIERFVVGSAQPNFGPTHVRLMHLIMPEWEHQRRIASIVSAYDDLIENNTRRIEILEEMARRLYEEWFVQFRFPGHEGVEFQESELGLIPEGWAVSCLGDIAEEVREAVHPSSVSPDTPYIGLEHLPRRSITLREWGGADSVSSGKLLFRRGDVLFGKIRPYFHKVVIAPFSGICSSDTILIRPKKDTLLGVVLCCSSSDKFVDYATQTSNGTKMPRADWKVLKNYPVLIPSGRLLSDFNGLVLGLVNQARNLMLKNVNLRAQRDLLLPKLISGEIDVSDIPMPT